MLHANLQLGAETQIVLTYLIPVVLRLQEESKGYLQLITDGWKNKYADNGAALINVVTGLTNGGSVFHKVTTANIKQGRSCMLNVCCLPASLATSVESTAMYNLYQKPSKLTALHADCLLLSASTCCLDTLLTI